MSKTKESLMDKYVMDTLELSEKHLLDQYLKDDPKLQVELDMRKDIADSMVLIGDRELRSMLDRVHGRVLHGSRKDQGSWVKLLGTLVVAVLVALGIYQIANQSAANKVTEPIRYASYYTIDENATRSVEGPPSTTVQAYVKAFKEKDFGKVIGILTPTNNETDNEERLILAIAALESGNTKLAKEQLQVISDSGDFYFVDHARWFTGLLYLKEGNIAEGKNLLEALASDPKADHHSDAKNFLENL